MNVIFMGRLTADPELRYTTAVTSQHISIAVIARFKTG